MAWRYRVLDDFRSTVLTLTPSTFTYACPELDARDATHEAERPVNVQVRLAALEPLEYDLPPR
jgi:hypothetical protein